MYFFIILNGLYPFILIFFMILIGQSGISINIDNLYDR